MRTSSLFLLGFVGLLQACAGPAAQKGKAGGAGAIDENAERFTGNGLTVARPAGWVFAAPDASTPKDTLIVLVGPAHELKMGPMVSIVRRSIPTSNRALGAGSLLTDATLEVVQRFNGFEAVVAQAEATVAGQKGRVVRATFKESLADGTDVERRAEVYVVVVGANVWFVHCTLPKGDAFDAEVESILASIAIETA